MSDARPKSNEGGKGRRPRRRRGKGPKKRGKKTDERAKTPLAKKSKLDTDKPVEEPLSKAEVAELKEHFEFLRKHRKLLRLKVNAAEDLLLNGARDPEHRGVAKHLLAKVDRSSLQQAMAKMADAAARTRLLEGVVRFSTDVQIVLQYLESLSESASRKQAAEALSAGLRGLDFEKVSAAQMRRLLDLVVQLFDAKERPALVMSLLSNRAFRESLHGALDGLPPEVTELVEPLSAAHAAVLRGERADPIALGRGLTFMLGAPDGVLRRHPEAVRRRLFELGLGLADDAKSSERGLNTLLGSFDPSERAYSDLAMLRAGDLLRRHEDEAAKALLEAVKKAHPGFALPARWLNALKAPRVGRVALTEAGEQGIRRAFWLDGQRPVWAVVGTAEETERFAEQAAVHGRLSLPGVAPFIALENSVDGRPAIIIASVGAPAKAALKKIRLDVRQRLIIMHTGVVLLRAVALAGYVLPDIELSRFLCDRDARLTLADVRGIEPGEGEATLERHLALAREWCELNYPRRDRVPESLRGDIAGAASLDDLARAIARAL